MSYSGYGQGKLTESEKNCVIPYLRGMDIKLQAKKLELIQWLSTIDNPSIIEKIMAIRDNQKEDWWDNISALEKESIEKGIEDADAGNLKNHKQARKIYGKWL